MGNFMTRGSATGFLFNRAGAAVGLGVAMMLAVVMMPATGQAQTLATGEPAAAFDVTNFVSGLTNPTDIAFLPDGRAVITSKNGRVVIRKPDQSQVTAGTIAVTPLHNEQGLLGVVADPAFATNKTLYFYASAGATTAAKHRILKITLGDNDMLAVAAAVTVVDQDQARGLPGLEGPANHNGGGMVIYKNQLYYGVGDTGGNASPPTNKNGTCLNRPNGKISRVNLDGSVPADNPLMGMAMVTGCAERTGALAATFKPDTRIFAWGFRNPWRFWIDSKTGKLWVGDVGETSEEEIAVGGKGQHFGWPFVEGARVFTANGCMGITPATPCTGAVHSYPHSMGNNSVTAGLIPEGCGWAAPWTSRYFFSDHGSGRVWTLDVNAARDGMVAGSVKDFATGPNPTSIRQGLDHALYIVSHGGGSVARFAPKGLAAMNCAPAAVPGGDGSMGGSGGAGGGTGGVIGTGSGGAGGAGSGSGGAGGSAGASGSGGSGTGTGGVSGTGTGGSSGTGSGGAGAGTGGSTGTGGSAPGGGNSGGGGCGIAGSLPAGLSLSALGLLAIVGLTVRRRRARK